MQINKQEININEAINFANQNDFLLKRRNNHMLLSDYQIAVLERNGFNYLNYNNYKEMLFQIEEYLNDNYDDELDLISSQIAEIIYYRDTKK